MNAFKSAYEAEVAQAFSIYVDNIITGNGNARAALEKHLEIAWDCYQHALKLATERGWIIEDNK